MQFDRTCNLRMSRHGAYGHHAFLDRDPLERFDMPQIDQMRRCGYSELHGRDQRLSAGDELPFLERRQKRGGFLYGRSTVIGYAIHGSTRLTCDLLQASVTMRTFCFRSLLHRTALRSFGLQPPRSRGRCCDSRYSDRCCHQVHVGLYFHQACGHLVWHARSFPPPS